MNTNRTDAVATADRRQSPRRELRQPTTVYLSMRSESGSRRFEGPLLNLNRTGLACRVQCSDMAQLNTDQHIAIEFQLPGSERSCDLNGRVVNVTESANKDRVLVGLQFIEDASWTAIRDDLEAALTCGSGQKS